MRKYITFFFSNIALFLTLQFGAVLTVFLLGLASGDKYVREQWILYCLFCSLHVILCFSIPYYRRLLSKHELLLGFLIIIFSWTIMGWYIS
jgi:uncharacterized BrkB/YihY/UPF0761 family membrane protein